MNQKNNFKVGNKSIEHLSKILIKEKPKKILVVRGLKSFRLFEPILNKIINADYSTFTVKESNISIGHSLEGIASYINNDCCFYP